MCWLFKSRGRGSLHASAAVFLSLSVRLLALSTEGTGRGILVALIRESKESKEESEEVGEERPSLQHREIGW
ncbi:hypothetical protein QQF64_025226 [Cirrhinus molitorella]|uniref:Secreted protein n=1 Tax=Cirrhinus molitorella TaxID=172907 RepID=A0ABR3NNK7_9TELE